MCCAEVLKRSFKLLNKSFQNLWARFWEANTVYEAVFTVGFKCLNLLRVCQLDVRMLQNTSDQNSFYFAPAECENFLEDGLSSVCASSQGVLKRESGSESDLFPLPGDGMEDLVFGKVGKSAWDMVKKALRPDLINPYCKHRSSWFHW